MKHKFLIFYFSIRARCIAPLLLLLIIYPLLLSAQTNLPKSTFNWNDTVFTRNAIHRINIERDVEIASLASSATDSAKPLVAFLKSNPFIKIEVDRHTDSQGSSVHNLILSKNWAQAVVNLLISMGIDSVRLVPKGWGASRPLPGCSAADIAKMKTQQEKEAAWQADRRTEVKIITDSANTFGWNDTHFMYGSKRIFHVLFELDKADLKNDSTGKACLDSVVRFLQLHPYLKVGIYNHTDARGSVKHNIVLSQARAWMVASWLIAAGIDSARLVVKGWEGRRPIYTQQQIQRMSTGDREKVQDYNLTNRRTELVILGTYYKQ